MSEQELENSYDLLVNQLIASRNGANLASGTELLLLTTGILFQSACEFKTLSKEEQIELGIHVVRHIYECMEAANLVPSAVKNSLDSMVDDVNALTIEVRSAIDTYNTLHSVADLPAIKKVTLPNLKKLKKLF